MAERVSDNLSIRFGATSKGESDMYVIVYGGLEATKRALVFLIRFIPVLTFGALNAVWHRYSKSLLSSVFYKHCPK